MAGAYGNSLFMDASANAADVSTLGTLLSTMAVNIARRYACVQNQSVNVAYVVLDDGVSGTPTIFAIDPAIGAGRQGGFWDTTTTYLHTGRIRIYGTAGATVTAGQV